MISGNRFIYSEQLCCDVIVMDEDIFKHMRELAVKETSGDPSVVKPINRLFDKMEEDGRIARKLWANPETRLEAVDVVERYFNEKKRTIEELKAEKNRLKTELENQQIKAAMNSWRLGVRR